MHISIVDTIQKYSDELHGIFNLFIFKRGHFLLIFNHTYECLYHNLWWKIDLQNWRWKIKDQDQFVKITSSDLDRPKDRDQLSDLDLWDQDRWSFYSSASEATEMAVRCIMHIDTRVIEVADFKSEVTRK